MERRGEKRRLQVRRAGKRREKMEREGGVRRGGNVMDKIKEYNILIREDEIRWCKKINVSSQKTL